MPIIGYEISEREKRIRKWWLGFLCFFAFHSIVFSILGIMADDSNSVISLTERLKVNYLAIFITVIIFLVSRYMLYYCAYKRHGNILLTFNLLVGPLLVAIDFIINFQNKLNLISAISLIIIILWYMLCFKLREINKKLQVNELISSNDYWQAIASIREAANLNELNLQFRKWIEDRPSRFVNALKKEYDVKKVNLP